MHDAELRALFPTVITRGALLRADGIAVGLVSGGAPAWDLLALDARARIGGDFHRLLLAQEQPLDILVVDQPPDLVRELSDLQARRDRAAHPLLAEALDAIGDYLADLGRSSGSRAKQVIWAVTGGKATDATIRTATSLDLVGLLRGSAGAIQRDPTAQAALAQAREQARRLAESLRVLGGSPPAQVMDAEAIARLLYLLADPVRAARYPLTGPLLERVRRVIVVEG